MRVNGVRKFELDVCDTTYRFALLMWKKAFAAIQRNVNLDVLLEFA